MLSEQSPAASSQLLTPNNEASVLPSESNALMVPSQPLPTKHWYNKKKKIIPVVLGAIVFLFLVIFLPVFFTVVHKNGKVASSSGNSNAGNGGSSGGGTKPTQPVNSGGVLIGGDGSTVKLENGTEFTYQNSFGGFWVQDPNNPFNNNAQPNSWTPPLNTSWVWGVDRVYGVNLGGLFVLEPFITPDIYQRYPGASDEFSLSQLMAADTANGGLQQLEDHYNTFITEQDIAEIAGAGLNFLRVPLAFWAVETWASEPFLERTSWKYFVRLLEWARKYGLRVCLDLHAVPGSQNGFNHSGRSGAVNFVKGNMGIANAERTLYYLRVITEFISQPAYSNLVPVFGIVNEPLLSDIGMNELTSFYLKAHDTIREITGKGAGNGPYIAIHDGFSALSNWDGFLQGSDRIILDTHPYFVFGGVDTSPIAVAGGGGIAGGKWPLQACDTWGVAVNESRSNFGVLIAGEFAATPNDCGLFILGTTTTSSNPQCSEYVNWQTYNDTMKQGIMNFVSAQFDTFGDWFFWTWKIGASGVSGQIESPGWSYQLGLRNGWIPKDPRSALGICQSLGSGSEPFDGTFLPWQTGTPSSIPAASSQLFPWPPNAIASADVPVNLLPTYTATAGIITLPPPTFTSVPSSVTQSVNGWFNNQDTEGGITAIAGCPYPDEYSATFSVIPTAPCTGPDSAPASVITPPPVVPDPITPPA